MVTTDPGSSSETGYSTLTNTGLSRGRGVLPGIQVDPKFLVPQTLVTGAITGIHVEEYTPKTHICQEGNLWKEIHTAVLESGLIVEYTEAIIERNRFKVKCRKRQTIIRPHRLPHFLSISILHCMDTKIL